MTFGTPAAGVAYDEIERETELEESRHATSSSARHGIRSHR
jgi:hypothetical protein